MHVPCRCLPGISDQSPPRISCMHARQFKQANDACMCCCRCLPGSSDQSPPPATISNCCHQSIQHACNACMCKCPCQCRAVACLVVAVKARHHQHLLKELGGLGQRVPVTCLQPAMIKGQRSKGEDTGELGQRVPVTRLQPACYKKRRGNKDSMAGVQALGD